MILTAELKEIFDYIKDNPGVSLKTLSTKFTNTEHLTEYLLSHHLIEHVCEEGWKVDKYKVSLDGEVAIETDAINLREKQMELAFKLLDLIIPTITAFIGFFIGLKF